MLLSCDQIRKRGIITHGVEDSFRFNSYDLTVGTIIKASGEEVKEHLLQPQGVVEVIASEFVNVPQDVVGYALVKTKLCNWGILPLNIGIIDSGYQGHLSTMLLNFSNQAFRIEKGDVFLRLTFQECYVASNFKPTDRQPYTKYISDKKNKMIRFSNNFLNLENSIFRITNSIFNKYILQVLGVAAVLLILYPFIVLLGFDYVINNKNIPSQKIEQQIEKLEQRIKQLESLKKSN